MEELRKREKCWYVKHINIRDNECFITGPLTKFGADLSIICGKALVNLRGESEIIKIREEPEYIEEGDLLSIIEKEVDKSENDVKMYLLKKSDNN